MSNDYNQIICLIYFPIRMQLRKKEETGRREKNTNNRTEDSKSRNYLKDMNLCKIFNLMIIVV